MAAVEADPDLTVTLDLEASTVSWPEGSVAATMPEGARRQFLSGDWDSLGQLLAAGQLIEAAAARLPYTRGFAAP
jgi:3-isopropylmalate/(R)-2-methylmalate dehydratase small subunit